MVFSKSSLGSFKVQSGMRHCHKLLISSVDSPNKYERLGTMLKQGIGGAGNSW